MEHIGKLGFSMTYQDTISLEQSNCELANFVCNGLFNTFQHCSTLFNTVSTQLRCAQKQVKEPNKIELSVNAKTFQRQRNAEAVAVVSMIGEMEE